MVTNMNKFTIKGELGTHFYFCVLINKSTLALDPAISMRRCVADSDLAKKKIMPILADSDKLH
jgi:hypothetical protein